MKKCLILKGGLMFQYHTIIILDNKKYFVSLELANNKRKLYTLLSGGYTTGKASYNDFVGLVARCNCYFKITEIDSINIIYIYGEKYKRLFDDKFSDLD